MAVNLTVNSKNALEGFAVVEVHWSLDSSAAQQWIRGAGFHSQFIGIRVQMVEEHKELKWHYLDTPENPADQEIRSGSVKESRLWYKGKA